MPRTRSAARRRAPSLALAIACVVVLGACSTEAPSRTELVDALRKTGMPTSEARCASDALVDELSESQLATLVERGAGGAPYDDPKQTDDTADRVRAALDACESDALAEPTGPGVDTTSTTVVGGGVTATTDGASLSPASSTTLPGASTSAGQSASSTSTTAP